jgi:hypothetical protein
MVLAISAAEPVNVRGGGCVESVVTRRTHLRFRFGTFVEVEGIDLASRQSTFAPARESPALVARIDLV